MGDLAIGERFAERYDIEGRLGEGGMGTVYRAKHAFTGRPVALKVLNELLKSDTARARFLREAQAPSSIAHPSLVEVLDAGEEDGVLYLAMELLEGQDLDRAIESGALTDDELVGIAVELLGVLSAAHEIGLVHRDIKPANVFLLSEPDEGGRIKLLDFGISGLVASEADEGSKLTRTGTVLGTPLFMSPEQARGERVDGRSDVWAVGAVLFRGLTGKPHFTATSYNLLISEIITGRPPPISSVRADLSEPLARVVDRALEPSLDERWPSAGAMRDALAACPTTMGEAAAAAMGTAPTVASQRPPAPVSPSHRTAAPAVAPASRTRTTTLRVVAGLTLVCAGIALGAALMGSSDSEPTSSPAEQTPETSATEASWPPEPMEPSTTDGAEDGADDEADDELDEAVEAIESAVESIEGLRSAEAERLRQAEEARRARQARQAAQAAQAQRAERARGGSCANRCARSHHACARARVGDPQGIRVCAEERRSCVLECR